MHRLVVAMIWMLVISACASTDSVATSGDTGETIIGCPSGPWFPASALDDGAPLIEESAVPEVVDAIAPFLANEEGQFWPQDEWRLLHADETSATVVNIGSPDRPDLAFMSANKSNGEWRWAGSGMGGDCALVIQTPAGLNTVEWELDASAELTSSSTSISVFATERECVSGQAMGERLQVPDVVVTDEAVLIVLTAVRPSGEFHDCQGNPSQSVVIDLDEPLGDREVRDGRIFAASLRDLLS